MADDPISSFTAGHAPFGARCLATIHYTGPHFCDASGRVAGGAEGTRTPDIRLAKAALSQLSYGPPLTVLWMRRFGWASLESNQGPQSYQDCALAD
jgi:hypothetical protein